MVKEYHEVFAAAVERHREVSCFIGGNSSSDLGGLDEDLVASDLGFASVRNWRWRGGRNIFCGLDILFGLLEMSLCGGKRFGEMFAQELGHEPGPHGEVPGVDGFCPSQDDRAEGSAVQELQ